jgi:rRNA processing protein Krr1/Pno1
MINEETFVDTINLLDVMVKKNKTDEDTVLLLRRILKLLPLSFPNVEQAKLLIDSYCFEVICDENIDVVKDKIYRARLLKYN